MLLGKWTRAPQFPLVLFLVAIFVPTGAIGWLTWRLIQQDQALESQRIQERLENSADLLTAALERRLAVFEEPLSALEASPKAQLRLRAAEIGQRLADDAVVVVFDQDGPKSYPAGRLPYHPAIPPGRELSEGIFAEGEALELQKGDYSGALARFGTLAKSANPIVRAGALLRMGRSYRKLGKVEAALAVYEELSHFGSVSIRGLPAELLARHARCELLEEAKRLPEAQREASALYSGLHSDRWQLTGAAYRFYSKEASARAGPVLKSGERERVALAEAVESLWAEWHALRASRGEPAGRKGLSLDDGAAFVFWRGAPERLVGIAAGSRFLKEQWLTVVEPLAQRRNVRLILTDAEGRPISGQFASSTGRKARRSAADTRMPWDLQVESLDPVAELAQALHRRRLLLTGFAVMAIGLLASGYFSARAMSRELAVAGLKSDFVSAVSHEFRTPLTSMCQLAELFVSSRVAGEEQRQQYYRLLAREAQHLRRLVESLLDFGRMEGGAREYRLEQLDAAEVVREVAGEFQEEVAEHGYRVELLTDSAPLVLRADTEALRRALWNLMDNAVKYSPEFFTVWVEAVRDGRNARIRVRDRGLGIPASEQSKIFKKFVRGAGANKAGVKGTGIGLSMVQHIVQAHRGRVTVESEPGRGSTFTVLLPLEG